MVNFDNYKAALNDCWLRQKLRALDYIDSDNAAMREAARLSAEACDREITKFMGIKL